MLITKEEHEMKLKEKDRTISEYVKALEETTAELVAAEKLLKEKEKGCEGESKQYYIQVPVEKECLSCPKLELQTVQEAAAYGDIKIHECKHVSFCKEIRANWEEVNKINCGDNGTQNRIRM